MLNILKDYTVNIYEKDTKHSLLIRNIKALNVDHAFMKAEKIAKENNYTDRSKYSVSITL